MHGSAVRTGLQLLLEIPRDHSLPDGDREGANNLGGIVPEHARASDAVASRGAVKTTLGITRYSEVRLLSSSTVGCHDGSFVPGDGSERPFAGEANDVARSITLYCNPG